MNNLKKIIVYFLKNKPSLLRTEIMKYVYLFEHYYQTAYGRKFTETNFIRYEYGPYDENIKIALDDLCNERVLLIDESISMRRGNTYYIYYLNEDPPSKYDDLPHDAVEIAEFVLIELKNKVLEAVLDYTYKTAPMRVILEEEEKGGYKLNGRLLDMQYTGPIYKPSRERLLKARKRINEWRKKLPPVSDEEYMLHEMEIYREFEDIRRRANSVTEE